MTQMIFVNLPVADVARSRAFYGALGFGFDERFSDDGAACVVVSDSIFLMILQTEKFAGYAPRPPADSHAVTAHLLCLSRDSRDAVDEITDKAVAAGGSDNAMVQEMGDFMYGRSFSDPDGHVFEPMWMDVEKALASWSAAPAGA